MSALNRHYRLHHSGKPMDITVLGDYIVDAPPELELAKGHTFAYIRSYAERKGWAIEPLTDTKPTHVEFSGIVYMFTWRGEICRQIIKHEDGEETIMKFSDLPPQVKAVI